MEKEIVPESEVKVKLSFCQKCNGVIRAAIDDRMTKSSIREFFLEAMKYNLGIKLVSLIDYRDMRWCSCIYEKHKV